jgi:hypothetical protein
MVYRPTAVHLPWGEVSRGRACSVSYGVVRGRPLRVEQSSNGTWHCAAAAPESMADPRTRGRHRIAVVASRSDYAGEIQRRHLSDLIDASATEVSPLTTIAMWLRDFCGTLALQAQTSGRLCNGRPANMLLKISNLRSAKFDASFRLSGSLELRRSQALVRIGPMSSRDQEVRKVPGSAPDAE